MQSSQREVIFLVIAVIFTYMLPTFIVALKNDKKAKNFSLLNLLLGWTIIGWVILCANGLYEDMKISRKKSISIPLIFCLFYFVLVSLSKRFDIHGELGTILLLVLLSLPGILLWIYLRQGGYLKKL
ncbi:MAG: superinfection immunity protein [Candidatus Omnitrophota bacterium]